MERSCVDTQKSQREYAEGQCPKCAALYRLPLAGAGTSIKCAACGLTFSAGEGPTRSTEAGQRKGAVIRHEPRTRPFTLALGTEVIEAIEEHVTRHIGPIELVFHEIVSDLVHVDIHWVRASDTRPWHALVTSGMSDLPMASPESAAECRFAELMIRLPPEWRLSQADFSDEIWYWPLRWLKILARLPHRYQTWLWEGHTVPNGDPPEPLASNTKLCCVMLVPPFDLPDSFRSLKCGDKTIRLFSVVPLYLEEMSRKLRHGYESILARLEKHGVDQVVRIDRPSVCRSKWFGLF